MNYISAVDIYNYIYAEIEQNYKNLSNLLKKECFSYGEFINYCKEIQKTIEEGLSLAEETYDFETKKHNFLCGERK